MTSTADLLGRVKGSLEQELQSRLRGLFGGFVRAYLPQAWVFRTDRGDASLLVDRDGRASVADGVSADPDVTVELPYARLEAALASRGGARPPPGEVKVTPHTAKGRAAFDYLRPRLGL